MLTLKKEVYNMAKKKSSKMDTKLLILAVAVALVLILSGVQAMQLSGLKSAVESGAGITAAKTSSPSTSTSSETLQTNLQNLPQMVGGC